VLLIVSLGPTVSMVALTGLLVLLFPAMSVATAVKLCVPPLRELTEHCHVLPLSVALPTNVLPS